MTVLLVTGSRTFCEATPDKSREDYMDERRALGFALDWIKPTKIIHGGAKGADRWAGIWADKRGVECHVEYATGEWPAAGPRRNQRMVDMGPDMGCAFPGGVGTVDCTRRMERAGIPIHRVEIK